MSFRIYFDIVWVAHVCWLCTILWWPQFIYGNWLVSYHGYSFLLRFVSHEIDINDQYNWFQFRIILFRSAFIRWCLAVMRWGSSFHLKHKRTKESKKKKRKKRKIYTLLTRFSHCIVYIITISFGHFSQGLPLHSIPSSDELLCGGEAKQDGWPCKK